MENAFSERIKRSWIFNRHEQYNLNKTQNDSQKKKGPNGPLTSSLEEPSIDYNDRMKIPLEDLLLGRTFYIRYDT